MGIREKEGVVGWVGLALLVIAAACIMGWLLTGCAGCPERYVAGENFGNSGATRCNTVNGCVVE